MEQTTLFEYVLKNGGATLGADFKPIENKRGYCVSLAGFETRLFKRLFCRLSKYPNRLRNAP